MKKVSTMDQLRSCAEKIKGYIGGLISNLASTTTAALEEMDEAKLDKSGGTMTGNLTGKYITGTWLQTTAVTDLNKKPGKVAVLDDAGWIYHRTPAELIGDLGAVPTSCTVNGKALTGNVSLAAADVGAQALTNGISITIPITGWGSDSTAGYPNYYDITATGVTAKDRADLVVAPGSLTAAKACGLCPATETLAGKIRIRAAKVPSATITAEYWIEKGKV